MISEDSPECQVNVVYYTLKEVKEFPLSSSDLLANGDDTQLVKSFLTEAKAVTWVDVQGLGSRDILLKIAELFELHALTMSDVVNIPQRPKTDIHDNYLLNVGVMAQIKSDGNVDLEQLSVLWGKNFVVTFQERLGDILDPVRERVRKGKGPIRKSSCDYLAYAIIDTTVDAFYPILESIGEQLEDLEDRIVSAPTEDALQEVYQCKRELLSLRRSVWPQREAVSALTREENPFVKKGTRIYFRDTYEHLVQVMDIVETYRELAGSFMDVYLSSISNRMNEVMKVLTIMGTIFIPLSFFAGVFGMNFEYMPELKVKWAYPAFWVFIFVSTGSMLFFFRRKGWIGSAKRK
ncbi:UNVERIFIED_CONTAM: hypothetical protein GTU68_018331 [Idotea baltica]|nr:hypothetical protein [Idotea baltica]